MKRVVLLVSALLLTACVAPPTTHHRPGVSHATATGPISRDRLHAALAIRSGQVEPPATWLDVPVGSTVTVSVTSDVADRIMAGSVVLATVAAGESKEVRFTPPRSGVFEIRTAISGLVLAQFSAS